MPPSSRSPKRAASTRAADRLHVVQSAVSAGVRKLERELGASLFDRSTHHVKLTDSGRALLPAARATLAARAGRSGCRRRGAGGACAARSCWARCRPRGCARSTSRGCWPRSAHSTRESRSAIRHSGGSSEMAREVIDGRPGSRVRRASRRRSARAEADPADGRTDPARGARRASARRPHRRPARGRSAIRRWSTFRPDGASGWRSTARSPPRV